jgi:hypothetical protein
MAKIYQVRYTVGENTVAHEHYTEKGAKQDAKALSKVIGNAMLGEIDEADDGSRTLARIWEYAGGESGKAIPKDNAPLTPVNVIKTADETKLAEGKIEKKPKAPKKTDEERIAEIAADAQAKLDAIKAGTFVLPVRGPRKTATGEPRVAKAKVDAGDKAAKFREALSCTEETAKLLTEIGVTTVSRRAKVAVIVMDNQSPIFASQVAEELNSKLEESEVRVDVKEVIACVNHLNYLFTREEQPWRITVRQKDGGDKRLNFVPIRVEYDDQDETIETTEETVEGSEDQTAA